MAKYDKILADMKAALLKKAMGYEYEEREAIASKPGKPDRVKITKRYVPADLAAFREIKQMIDDEEW